MAKQPWTSTEGEGALHYKAIWSDIRQYVWLKSTTASGDILLHIDYIWQIYGSLGTYAYYLSKSVTHMN